MENLMKQLKEIPLLKPDDVNAELYRKCCEAAQFVNDFPEVEGMWLIREIEHDRADDTVYTQILIAAKELTAKHGLKTKESMERVLDLDFGINRIFRGHNKSSLIFDYYDHVDGNSEASRELIEYIQAGGLKKIWSSCE